MRADLVVGRDRVLMVDVVGQVLLAPGVGYMGNDTNALGTFSSSLNE